MSISGGLELICLIVIARRQLTHVSFSSTFQAKETIRLNSPQKTLARQILLVRDFIVEDLIFGYGGYP